MTLRCCGGVARVYYSLRSRVATRLRCCRPNCSRWKRVVVGVGQCTMTHSSVLHSVTGSESESKRRDTNSLTARTQCAAHNLHFKNALYTKVGTTSEGRAFTVPGHQIKSHDDVSSGPRPKAHWYMLTHYCCNDTAPLQDPASCCTAFQSHSQYSIQVPALQIQSLTRDHHNYSPPKDNVVLDI